MRSLDDFLPFLAAYAQSVPDPLAYQYLRWAATELCERTRCWRFVDVITVSGLEDQIICTPAGADLFEIEDAWWSNGDDQFYSRPLARVPFADVSADLLRIDAQNMAVKPDAITQVSQQSVLALPRAAGVLKLSMFLKPSKDTMEVPDFLFDQFAQPIACGALYWILNVPGQTYTNPQLAQMMASDHNSICDRNFAHNIRGQQRAPARARSRFV